MNSTKLIDLPDLFDEKLPTNLSGVPSGFLPLLVSRVLHQLDHSENQAPGLVFVASDGRQLEELQSALLFFAPERTVLELPAWDCLPYDRVSPSGEVSAQRIATLAKLAQMARTVGDAKQVADPPILVLTTANALVQRQIPLANMKDSVLELAPGKAIGMDATASWLSKNGFERNSSVHDRGEYAVRGGILDYFAPGDDDPVRLDFFGDTLESIRSFDIASQRTISGKQSAVLVPMSEVDLNAASIANFRSQYLELFGAATRDDVLYQAVSEGRRYTGIEHWLPLFHPKLDNLFDYFAGFGVICDHQTEKALEERLKQIKDHYQARRESLNMSVGEGAPYKPVEPGSLYLNMTLLKEKLAETGPIYVSPFELPPSPTTRIISLGATTGHSFAAERESGKNVFNSVVDYAVDQRSEGRTVVLLHGVRDRGNV